MRADFPLTKVASRPLSPAGEGNGAGVGAEAGLTLLELLVALAVFGLILATLAVMVQFTLGVSTGRMREAEVRAEMTPVLDYLEAVIGDARPGRFAGGPEDLRFVASLGRPSVDLGGLRDLHLDASGGALRLSWSPVGGPDLPAPKPEGGAVLMTGVSTVRFRYFGAESAGVAAEWHDRWAGVPALPALVGITIVRATGAAEGELIVAPRVSGTASPNQR